MKTEKQVQTDVIALLRGSALAGSVSGGIYRYGQRPRDSRSEDIVVEVETGVPGEIRRGVVLYIPVVPEAGFRRSLPVPTGKAPVPTGKTPVPTGKAPVPTGKAPVPTGKAPVPTGKAPVPTGKAPGRPECIKPCRA